MSNKKEDCYHKCRKLIEIHVYLYTWNLRIEITIFVECLIHNLFQTVFDYLKGKLYVRVTGNIRDTFFFENVHFFF